MTPVAPGPSLPKATAPQPPVPQVEADEFQLGQLLRGVSRPLLTSHKPHSNRAQIAAKASHSATYPMDHPKKSPFIGTGIIATLN